MSLTIGQLAKQNGLRASTLRYYEEQGLLKPAGRTESGYRRYDHSAEQSLRFIRRAQRLGFSLADIKTLLQGREDNNLSDETIIRVAEARYLHLEAQVTQLLVLQHELGLLLQDVTRKASQGESTIDNALFEQFLERVCRNPLNQPAQTMLDWLINYTGCRLTTSDGQKILNRLQGQHVHVWQEGDEYHILVVSDDPAVGEALESLARLEADCRVHAHPHQTPEFADNEEGFLLIARGKNAFIFARLFLILEKEEKPDITP